MEVKTDSATTMASDHLNSDSMNLTEPHTIASSKDRSRASATERTSLRSGGISIDGHGYGAMGREDATRQETWNAGIEATETAAVFRPSDMNRNMGSSLDGAEVTKEGPPSYESVIKARAPIIPEKKNNNNHHVITTQPLSSSTVSQPAVRADVGVALQSAPERGDSVTEQLDNFKEYDPESTCCNSCQQRCLDCCDACGRCITSEEVKCFCEVSLS
jgi:hypothetical protein